jgi:hypothetical protein
MKGVEMQNVKFILKVREDMHDSRGEHRFDFGSDVTEANRERDLARDHGFWAEVIAVEVLDRSFMPAKRG